MKNTKASLTALLFLLALPMGFLAAWPGGSGGRDGNGGKEAGCSRHHTQEQSGGSASDPRQSRPIVVNTAPDLLAHVSAVKEDLDDRLRIQGFWGEDGHPSLLACKTDEDLRKWKEIHNEYDIRSLLMERFYQQSPAHQAFADVFSAKLFAQYHSYVSLSSGNISAAPTRAERFFELFKKIMVLIPSAGASAASALDLTIEVSDHTQKIIATVCTTWDASNKPVFWILSPSQNRAEVSRNIVAAYMHNSHQLDLEIEVATLLIMARYCHGLYWDAISDDLEAVRKMAEFAIFRIEHLLEKEYLKSDLPLAPQLVAGIQRIPLRGYHHHPDHLPRTAHRDMFKKVEIKRRGWSEAIDLHEHHLFGRVDVAQAEDL